MDVVLNGPWIICDHSEAAPVLRIHVIDLRDFYSRPLGAVVRRLVARQVRRLWPNVTGETIVGLGFATPYLRQFRDQAAATIGFMPAAQGVVRWPADGASAVSLVDEVSLPLGDASVERVLVVHGVETVDALKPMLREIWRVLAPGGRLLIVATNRSGLWARVDSTPFGHGRPFSKRQLSHLLREGMFAPAGWAQALYMPPFRFALLIRSAVWLERIGTIFWPGLSGVVLVEAVKEMYAMVPPAERRFAARLRPKLGYLPIDKHRLEVSQSGGHQNKRIKIPAWRGFGGSALANSKPLARMIAKYVDQPLLADITVDHIQSIESPKSNTPVTIRVATSAKSFSVKRPKAIKPG